MEWQPISTAPKGVDCLFWIRWSNTPVVGQWDGKSLQINTEHADVSCGVFCYGGSVCTQKETDPINWMPLPPPPKE